MAFEKTFVSFFSSFFFQRISVRVDSGVNLLRNGTYDPTCNLHVTAIGIGLNTDEGAVHSAAFTTFLMENLGLPKDRQAFFSTKFIYQNRSNFWTGPWSDAYFYFYFFLHEFSTYPCCSTTTVSSNSPLIIREWMNLHVLIFCKGCMGKWVWFHLHPSES